MRIESFKTFFEKKHYEKIKKKIGDDEFYFYKGGKYLRQKLATRHGCTGEYRIIPVKGKPSRKLLICIRKKKGPRGGKTKVLALLRDIRRTKKTHDPDANKALKWMKKVKKELEKDK